MKDILDIFKSAEGIWSSKRVCGVIGWVVVLICYGYCCACGKPMPEMGELIAACVALLGVDSIASIFKKDKHKHNDNNDC